VSTRVSPVERVRADIDTLFASERELGDVLEEVARLGVRLLLQTAIEAEVTEFLGRERYAHGERARPGNRNGHCPTTIKTTTGPITIERPKLRGTDEAFASRLLGIGVCRTNALEPLVIAGFVRGLSVRDVEATLAEALGPEAALSKSTVSRVCEAIEGRLVARILPGEQPRRLGAAVARSCGCLPELTNVPVLPEGRRCVVAMGGDRGGHHPHPTV
jgi:transposase-like protein